MAANQAEEKSPSIIKRSAKFLFDVPAWIGTDQLAENAGWIKRLVDRIFTIKKKIVTEQAEDFQEMAARLQITEQELTQKKKHFFSFSWIFLLLAILSLFYMTYLWSHSSILVGLIALIVTALFFIQACFYSFCYFQIQQQRLGCSLKDWLSWLLRGRTS